MAARGSRQEGRVGRWGGEEGESHHLENPLDVGPSSWPEPSIPRGKWQCWDCERGKMALKAKVVSFLVVAPHLRVAHEYLNIQGVKRILAPKCQGWAKGILRVLTKYSSTDQVYGILKLASKKELHQCAAEYSCASHRNVLAPQGPCHHTALKLEVTFL